MIGIIGGGLRPNEPALNSPACAESAKNFTSDNLAQKSAIYGEGLYRKCRPEGQKSAITEKEIAIFELRKVLFPEKHLRELPGALTDTVPFHIGV